MDDLSPRSREVFQTILDIARRDLEVKNIGTDEVIRRIVRDLQRHVETLSPAGSTIEGQRQSILGQGQQMALEPRQTVPMQPFVNVTPMGQGQGQGQVQSFPMARVQSSPYPMPAFLGYNTTSPFAAMGPMPTSVPQQLWPLQQFPPQSPTQVTTTVPGQLQQQPQPQQPVFGWGWTQMPGNAEVRPSLM